MRKKTIQFLCTGNSCRSQMAEGFAKKYLGDMYEVSSSGMEAQGIHPLAIEVMKEKGIDISEQTSDVLEPKALNEIDFVITLCKDSMERCPVILPRPYHYHWAFDDPAKALGPDQEVLEEFRRVRDEIEATIQKFIQGDAGLAYNLNKKKNDHFKQRDDFGEQMKKFREQAGVSLQELACELHISKDYLVKTEQNSTEPSKFFLHRFASACQMEYGDLVDQLYYVDKNDILALFES